ncbi:Signal transduction histidine kinase [Raineyella antarctica]|uniref:histidine kinase n=1 Tax=Raineyella antarctica TaxID=1577474 RepID=A0A1G6H6Z3_9ACTN|nr:sensor histidine kinase [Raineyella antarctica]SDB89715.1 Signal transduction histidine kinase [Raineyella antarctica]
MQPRPGTYPPSAPGGRTTHAPAWLAWLGAVATGVVVAWIMFFSALVSTMTMQRSSGHMSGPMMPDRYDPYDPGYPNPTGPWSQSVVDHRWLPALFLACVVVAAGLVLRHLWPRVGYVSVVVGTAGYLALGGSLPVALIAPAIALVGLTAVRPGRYWVLWVALLVPMLWAVGWNDPYMGLTSAWLYPAIVFGIAAMLVPTLLAEVRRSQAVARHQSHADEMRQVAYRERLRIAQDLHDVVGHSLSTISLQAGVALRLLDENPAQARTSLEAIRTSAKDSLTDVRRTLGILRDPNEAAPLSPGPGLDRIDELVAPLVASGATVGLHRDAGLAATVPTPVQQVAFRIVQEALTNAVRHAPGTPVEVRIARAGEQLLVQVRNGGPAPAHPVVEGNGLRGMRERVTTLGGTLTIEDTGPGGVGITALLPLGIPTNPGSPGSPGSPGNPGNPGEPSEPDPRGAR